MRRLVTIVIMVGLLVGMILAVTACPKTAEPGGGTVVTQPSGQPMQPSETTVPEGTPPSPTGEGATPPAAPGEGGTTPPAAPGEGGGEKPAPPAPAPPAPGEGGK
jgi:hypothetical protein